MYASKKRIFAIASLWPFNRNGPKNFIPRSTSSRNLSDLGIEVEGRFVSLQGKRHHSDAEEKSLDGISAYAIQDRSRRDIGWFTFVF